MILDKIFRSINSPSVPLSSDRIIDFLSAGQKSTAGVPVTKDTVLGYPAVMRAVRLISESIAKLPLVVYRRTDNDGKERAREHPAYRLLWKKPNKSQTAYTFIQTLTANALLHGNGYAFIERSGQGPIGLHWLDPETTVPTTEHSEDGTSEIYYTIKAGGKDKVLSRHQVLHIKGLSYNGFVGYSVITQLRESFGLGLGAQRYGSVFFRNNARPNMVIEMPNHLVDEESISRFRNSWGDIHAGVENSHRPAILEDGAKVSAFAVNNEDAQFLQSREFEVVQIANIFGIPPHKLGAKISTSHNSLEQENRNFLNDGLSGWLCNWKHESEDKLLSESEKDNDSHIIEQSREELERADRQTEVDADATDVNNGIRTIDEVRRRRNLPVYPDGIGAVPRIPLNIGVLGEEPEPEPEPEPAPEPPEPPVAEPAEEDERDDWPTVVALVHRIATDNLRRVQRQAETAAKKGDEKYGEFLGKILVGHLDTFSDHLSAVGDARAVVVACLTRIHEDLTKLSDSADLPEAVRQIMMTHLADGPGNITTQLEVSRNGQSLSTT